MQRACGLCSRPCARRLVYERVKPWNDTMQEECGVVGIVDPDGHSVNDAIYYSLFALQHRGQESAGIAVCDGNAVRGHKAMGLVTDVFANEPALERLGTGHMGIGHVRYSTSGTSELINSQPLMVHYKQGTIALAHNGNLVNAAALREELQAQGQIIQTELDTEVIAALIARQGGDIVQALQQVLPRLSGSYALVILAKDRLIAARDPYGIRPLCLGKVDNALIVASESCALDSVGASFVRDIQPGELLIIDGDGNMVSHVPPNPPARRLCIFEYVYFARTDSIVDGISVYQARENAGRILAERFGVEVDIVSGVPDSSIPAAVGYARYSGIPYGESLAKNRYVGRTFIQPDQQQRNESVKIKLNALRRNVNGKRVLLIDDSIVRGTTSRNIVEMLRAAGAREVHMRISSPPVRFSCHLGIDTPDTAQLISATHTVEQIRKKIGADTLHFLDIEDLLASVQGGEAGFCLGCFNGDYPRTAMNTEANDGL